MTAAGRWCRSELAGAVLLLMVVALLTSVADALSPPKKDYCRNRLPTQCCRNVRDDDCSVPIGDTVCYCDDFCLQDDLLPNDPTDDKHDDCCPDYREVCLGDPPSNYQQYKKPNTSSVCYHEGRGIPQGEYIFNCNKWTCKDTKVQYEDDLCMVDEAMLERVNSNPARYSWTAVNHTQFWGRKAREGLVYKTGTFLPTDNSGKMLPILLRPDFSRIPRTFDAREKPEWSGLISGVSDQGWCGASWVFSTLGVAQDRHMILTREQQVQLSPQQVLSCAPLGQDACKGGYIDRAWNYLRHRGAVEEECYGFNYTSGSTSTIPSCQRNAHTIQCKVYKTEPAYRISGKVEDIQWEILNNGPVQALMRVYPDFFMYGGGIYSCDAEHKGDGTLHSVRIIGWGEEVIQGDMVVTYWLVANSWGSEWGEQGLFKLRSGVDECGIETFVLAVRGRNDWWKKQKRSEW